MVTEDSDALSTGDLVRFVDMPDPSMDSGTGELVKPVGKDRWVVAPTGDGKTRVVSKKCLRKLERGQHAGESFKSQPCVYSIAGTWDDWEVHSMRWNAASQRFEHSVTIGADGRESFKLLLGGDWDACLHPDKHNANPHEGHALQGPDDGGLDQEWTIGHHPADAAAPGSCFQVRLRTASDGRPEAVSWELVAAPPPPPQRQGAEAARWAAGARPRADAPSKYAAIRPEALAYRASLAEMRWRPPGPPPLQQAEAAEALERAEREARQRLARRLEAAAEAELLPIEDGGGRGAAAQQGGAGTAGARAADWEALLRQRRLRDAKSRLSGSADEEADAAPRAALEPEVGQPQEGPPPQEEWSSACVDCGAGTPYQRCSACLLVRVHKSSWQPSGAEKRAAAAPEARAPQTREAAFDQFWTFN